MVLSRPMLPSALLVALGCLATPAAAAPTTCGEVKALYKEKACCGNPEKAVQVCPYSFQKPACDDAEPQAPRDLTTGATGQMDPKAAVLTEAQAEQLPLVNVHYHCGAEHKSDEYNDASDSEAFDSGRRLYEGSACRPGFMCDASGLTDDQKAPYTFQYCKGDVQVGKSYEVHYVHSSAGYAYATKEERQSADIDGIEDGLGGAANGRGLLNPMVVVQGQVFQIVQGATPVDDLLHGWTVVDHSNSVMYAGSTTGPSHNNEVCSPYAITWHVDKTCHQVPPESFDNLCKQMKEYYDLEGDLYPHGSRMIVDPKYVVKPQYVTDLA